MSRANVLENHGIGTDFSPIPNMDGTQHCGSGPNNDVIAYTGMAFFIFFVARPSQGDVMVDVDPVAHLGRFSNDHPHAVVNKEKVADFCPGMDFNAGFFPGPLGDKPGQGGVALLVKVMGQAVGDHGPDHGIEEDGLKGGLASRVHGVDIASVVP